MAKATTTDYNTPVQHLESVTTTGPTSFIGTVERVIFNRGLFYIAAVTVESAEFEWDTNTITVTGQLGEIKEGDHYEFDGRVVDNPRYGLQFSSTGGHAVMPKNAKELARLIRGRSLGISRPASVSRQIFQALGETAVKRLLDDPSLIETVPDLEYEIKAALRPLFEQLGYGSSTVQIIQRLKSLGFTEWMVNVIFDRYGAQTLTQLDENPYQLAVDLQARGLSFNQIDVMAQNTMQMASDDDRRLAAALLCQTQSLAEQQGGSYVDQKQVLQSCLMGLNANGQAVSSTKLETVYQQLLTKHQLYYEADTGVYPATLYQAEWSIAKRLKALVTQTMAIDEQQVAPILDQVATEQAIEYDDIQRAAMTKALTNSVMLLTGGPGTGKTTILNGIVQSYLKLHADKGEANIKLVAPTGRAAKQINGVTGIEASTIHRLLGLTVDTDPEMMLETGDLTQLNGDLIIVDEMSMTSTRLFATLLAAVGKDCQLILVGDVDQLPSVGPGQVFYDLLNDDHLPQMRLTHIYRQASDSSIIPLAQRINTGEVDEDFFAPTPANKYARRQFVPAQATNVTTMVGKILQLYQNQHQQQLMDMQVLTPFHAGPSGTIALNQSLQALLNPPTATKPEWAVNEQQVLRVGDKVMQTVNDADRNVFNGDVGIIKTLEGNSVTNGDSKAKFSLKMTVDFDGQEVEYERPSQALALQLAYCMTIHKSQGSQSPVVVIPLLAEQFRKLGQRDTILHRNLLYTAVTRTSRALVMLGSPAAFVACAQSPTVYRATSLGERLLAVWDETNENQATPGQAKNKLSSETLSEPSRLTPALVEAQAIDPLIGMDGIKPGGE
ncbi:ATP-dependent RecD-like DNA helicase [Limosilactobacillus equigenerosi]|uniref:ATP-dependent RecD2 DNA helicase n=2 Tax=Limosilactobacillus TaxID=2742598 RepID=A0A0R1UZ65_9LACO|nr:ATP-dependent RecD-like DNA helicase [Limosilactobacillus equigenerosi]KRL95989.1 Exodeoxyribonuclease V alpha subunit [Limosilactobacillus equigenerosi DSM 18793 = JCM 14505]